MSIDPQCMECEEYNHTVQQGLGWAAENWSCSTCRRDNILLAISDLVSDLLYYDRKEDENLGEREIDREIDEGRISLDEMANFFKMKVEEKLKMNKQTIYIEGHRD